MNIKSALLIVLLSSASAGASAFNYCDKAKDPKNYLYNWMPNPMVNFNDTTLFEKDPKIEMDKNSISWAASLQIQTLTQILKKRGITLIALVQPSREEVFAHEKGYAADTANKIRYDAFIESLNKSGVISPNILNILSDAKYNFSDFYFLRDHHWNVSGSRISAQTIANTIKSYSSMNSSENTFSLISAGVEKHTGSFAENIQNSCRTIVEPEELNIFTSENSNTSLMDDKDADIIVVGTSNSATKKFSFVSFLEYYAQSAVEDHSISGGNAYSSLELYFSSKNYLVHKPKFIVWEVPITYGRNDISSWRRVNGFAQGMCADPVFSDILEPQKEYEITISDSKLIEIDFNNKQVGDLSVKIFNSKNNAYETISLKQSDRVNTFGRFLVDLNGIGAKSIQILGSKQPAAIKICAN